MEVVPAAIEEGEEGEAEEQPHAPKDQWKDFKLPYQVSTLEEFQLRAYWTDPDQVEWLWSRMHARCKIATPSGRMMALNKQSIETDLDQLMIPRSGFHYRGEEFQKSEKTPWDVHTVESRCFFAMIMWLLRNRTLKAANKLLALEMLLGVCKMCFTFLSEAQAAITAMILDPSGQLHHKELVFEATGVCRGSWHELLLHSPGCVEQWERLSKTSWMNQCLTSTLQAATFSDIIFFLLWVYCHPTYKARGENLFQSLALLTLPRVLHKLGGCLKQLAVQLSQQNLTALPVIRTKTGKATRQSDPVNKMLLMFRLRRQKLHRRAIALTHEDLALGGQGWCNMSHIWSVSCTQNPYMPNSLVKSKSVWPGILPPMEVRRF